MLRALLLLTLLGTGACASSSLHQHRKNITALQVSSSFVEKTARVISAMSLDKDIVENLAVEPQFVIGKYAKFEASLAGRIRTETVQLSLQKLTTFPTGESTYVLDTKVPFYGVVFAEDTRSSHVFVFLQGILRGPDGKIWQNTVMGTADTNLRALVEGRIDPQSGLDAALADAVAQLDAELGRASRP